jgi:pimeloyl-ACP methyl ester carboxylesterase
LIDAAGIRPRRTAKYYLKVYSAKTVKHLGPRLGPLGRRMQRRIAARMASSDYASAGELRPTFVKLVNEDLTELLPDIKAPTLLIWGEADDATPLADGRTMERLIPDAALIVFPGAGHYSYLDDPVRFAAIARNFRSTTIDAGTT